MNQYGLVELIIIKNDLPYRALLPMGSSWMDAKEVLQQMISDIDSHIKKLEEQQKEKEAADQQNSAA